MSNQKQQQEGQQQDEQQQNREQEQFPDSQESQQVPGEPLTRRKARNTISHQFRQYRLIIYNSTTDEKIKQYAAKFGYTPERISEGNALLDEFATALDLKKDKQTAFMTAKKEFRKKRAKADKSASYFMQIARFAFKDTPYTFEMLELEGRRKKSFSERVLQNTRFYGKLLSMPEAMEQIGMFNVTREDLQAGVQEVEATIAADEFRQGTRAEAIGATIAKDKALEKLRTWMKAYLKVMKVALAEAGQLQESLGVTTP
ncbi:MAG: hypothetical protein GY757_46190 [bacterium]|nr:hypothetical protein [bacterium]